MIDSYLSGTFLIIGSVIASVVGLLLARKFVHLDQLKATHEVGGYLLSVVGTMYAVLLGLVVVDAMSKFQQGIAITESEANSVADIYLLAERMPKERGEKVQKVCYDYVDRVINEEWKLMDKRCLCPQARKLAISVVRTVRDWEPVSESEKAIYSQALSESCQLWDNRRSRTNLSQHTIPPLEWVVLMIGGFITVVFTYFFGLENLRAQIMMTSMVSLIISLNMFLVMMFGYPFSGELKVSPDAFEVDKMIFDNQLGFNRDAPDAT